MGESLGVRPRAVTSAQSYSKRIVSVIGSTRETAVEVGAANLVDPFDCQRIIADLPAVMDKYRINTLREIIGGISLWEKT